MIYTNDGLTLMYDTPDAPALQGVQALNHDKSITVILTPPNPNNAVTVYYRVNGGPTQHVRAVAGRNDYRNNAQYFHATFPRLSLGQTVDYAVTGSCVGRQVPNPAVAREMPCSFQIADSENTSELNTDQLLDAKPPAPETVLFQLSGEFLARFTIRIDAPCSVGNTPDGIRVTWNAVSGHVAGPRLNGKMIQGADWMQIRPDGIANVDVRALLETFDGAKIMLAYTGIIELGEDGYQNFFANKLPNKLKVWTTPYFLASDETYMWLNRLQCVGVGEVSLDEMTYTYDVHALK